MQQSEASAGPAHPTGHAQPLDWTPRLKEDDVDLLSPTFASVPPAETNMRILRAGGQFEWLSVLMAMHGLRAAQHSMPCVRAGQPLAILSAAALVCASRHAQAAMITTCARPRVHH